MISCFVVQYADPTHLLLTGYAECVSELIGRAERLLSIVKLYFQKSGLLLNDKIHYIFMNSRHYLTQLQNDTALHLNGNGIKLSTVVQNLAYFLSTYAI